jgi:hypothetical protein
MTPQERAEKIYLDESVGCRGDCETDWRRLEKVIATQIEEAERGARLHFATNWEKATTTELRESFELGFSAGFCEAKAMAKGIAENVECNDAHCQKVGHDIADRIAKMEPK